MKSNYGYCYAYRSAWVHPAFNNLREAAIWNFLYQNAFYEDGESNINGYTFQLKRGQIAISTSFLAKGFAMSDKGVRVVIQKLVKLGMVGVQGTSRGTILTICNYDAFQRKEKTEGEPKGNNGANKGRAKGNNNNEDNEDNKLNEDNEVSIIDRFENFWDVYGYKVGKSDAKKVYDKIMKQGVMHDEIIQGVTRYQRYCQARGITGKYIKHPKSWLNGKHWQDEYPEYIEARKPTADDNCTAGILLALSEISERQGY